jgi:hypothetical protein
MSLVVMKQCTLTPEAFADASPAVRVHGTFL